MPTPKLALALINAGWIAGLTACASDAPQPEPVAPNGRYVTANGELLAGWMNVDVFHVPKGQRLSVTESFSVHATQYICIEGDIVMLDRDVRDPRSNAPDLRLSSDAEILIAGRIIGGAGRSFAGLPLAESAGQPGGDGSSISLSAPRYLILGALVAGRGGRGGAGSVGGAGGTIEVVGALASPAECLYIEPGRLKQLAAANAGFYGGAGGGPGEEWNGRVGTAGRSGGMTNLPWPHVDPVD